MAETLHPAALRLNERMTAWRRDIHRHPEIAFEEHRTAGIVAKALREFGYEVTEGIGGTGVVGTLKAGASSRAIGLRADMDALPMEEKSGAPHQSVYPGKFHGCGHDGHTSMLLGAAAILAETRNFDGTAHLIFQPAEEGEGGAVAMMEDGLFERFPVSNVYGLHNWPNEPLGVFSVRTGPMMAAFAKFDIEITGKGGHAALPHISSDPVIAMAAIISALQTIVSRNVDPIDSAVVSITKAAAGSAYNVIPGSAHLAGCTRYFSAESGALIHRRITEVAMGVASALGASAEVRFEEVYIPLVNDEQAAAQCLAAAKAVSGSANVKPDCAPVMASEDFSFMLKEKPGCYVFLGTGGEGHACSVHNPAYDFNDEALAIGASYWVKLVESVLAKG